MSEYAGGARTAYVTNATTADTIGMSAAVNGVRPLRVGRDIYVQCRMSVASATVGIGVILHESSGGTEPVGIAAPGPQTATATTLRDAAGSGDYWTQILIFDGGSAPHYEVRITTAPSSGNADVYTWSI